MLYRWHVPSIDPAVDPAGRPIRHRRVAVLYDDRPQSLTGLKLAALGLREHSSDLEIQAIAPGAPQTFHDWAARQRISIADLPSETRGSGWDVKPSILLHFLNDGFDEVIWFDTDIIATVDIRTLLSRFPAGTLVATEEYAWGYHQGSPARTELLGMEVGRTFAKSINSGIVRVDQSHRALIDEWARVLTTPSYIAAQEAPIHLRPVGYLGDQEVLGGLLGSRKYADIPVGQLRRGIEIAQCFGPSGFTVTERWRARKNLPALVHAMGRKPWARPQPVKLTPIQRLTATWENTHLDLTPYTHAVQPYLANLDESTDWVGPLTPVGRLLARIPSPALRELPLAVIDTSQRGLRRLLRIRQVPTSWSDGTNVSGWTD